MQVLDEEITGVLERVGTSTRQMLVHLGRDRGGSGVTGRNGQAGQARGGRRGLRQTRPPSRRTLSRMTNGQLT
ncbi:hypothetical protein QR98_0066000, partial [Sarcoptes scabiei]